MVVLTGFPTLLMSNCRGTPLGGFFSSTTSILGGGILGAGGCRDQALGGLGKTRHETEHILRSHETWAVACDTGHAVNSTHSGCVLAVGLSMDTVRIPLLFVDVRHLGEQLGRCTAFGLTVSSKEGSI